MGRWKGELAHLLPHLHTLLILYIPSTCMILLLSTEQLCVLFPLPEMPGPSSPSPSSSPLPGYSYSFFRSQHKHPSHISPSLLCNCTLIYARDCLHHTCQYLKVSRLCEYALITCFLTIPPEASNVSARYFPIFPITVNDPQKVLNQ